MERTSFSWTLSRPVDDNAESMKLRFDTFTARTLPSLEFFRSKGKVVGVDASQGREDVYALVAESLAEHTDPWLAAESLTEKSEMQLGLRPYPRKG